MTYTLNITRKPTYLHAVVTGRNTKENVTRYLDEVLAECKGRGCYRVLIEERLEGPRLGMAAVYQIASEKSQSAFGVMKAVAYVDVYAEGDSMQFAENVAVNRAMPVAVFPTVTEAEQWLLREDRGDAGSGAE